MHKTSHGWVLVILLFGVMLASACTQTYSQAPLATPSLISTGLFVSPFPAGQDPLQVVADLGTQTAAAKTAQAGGGSTTPSTAAAITGTPGTQAGPSATPTSGTAPATSAAASTVVPATQNPTQRSTTPVATSAASAPGSYTLQQGEHPYCLARRFDINPAQLLSANGITEGTLLYAGKVLTIPQSAGSFPGDRALKAHPTTYTVMSSNVTIYEVACVFGDVYPQDIASANGLTLSSTLTTGQQLTIP